MVILSAAGAPVWAQVVPSQANIDASAQRRLQETIQEGQRQLRISEQIERLTPALSEEKLTSPSGPILARKALAALVRLQMEGITPQDAMARAIRSSGIHATEVAKPASYLRQLFAGNSARINDRILAKLEEGMDPEPALSLPPFTP